VSESKTNMQSGFVDIPAGAGDGKPKAPIGLGKSFETMIEGFIFGSRWIQAPLYAGLIVAEIVYAYKFATELWHLVSHATTVTEEQVIISVLSLVDITMVANLIAMIVIGGYATFVSKLNVVSQEDRPDWLDKINAASLKIKLAASLVGISSIHLLKAFIDIGQNASERAAEAATTAAAHGAHAAAAAAEHGTHVVAAVAATAPKSFEALKYQIIIHAMFLVSAVMLALSERILHGPPHHDSH